TAVEARAEQHQLPPPRLSEGAHVVIDDAGAELHVDREAPHVTPHPDRRGGVRSTRDARHVDERAEAAREPEAVGIVAQAERGRQERSEAAHARHPSRREARGIASHATTMRTLRAEAKSERERDGPPAPSGPRRPSSLSSSRSPFGSPFALLEEQGHPGEGLERVALRAIARQV